jgi:hypothetical protein
VTENEFEDRLKESECKLREWSWMSSLTTRPEDAVKVLTDEARFLVALGREHPQQARRIGKLIVFYQRLIDKLKAHQTAPCTAL